MLYEASRQYGYGTDRAEVLRVWRAGCIIRTRWLPFLEEMVREDPEAPHLLFHPRFLAQVRERLAGAVRALQWGLWAGIPMPALGSALEYFRQWAGRAFRPTSFRPCGTPSAPTPIGG